MTPRRALSSVLSALMALVDGTGAAQAPAGSTPGSTAPVPVPGVERVEIRLAEFDVVVRDKSGRIIAGLRPENFSVVEDGVPLQIVAVDEWGAPAAPKPTAPAAMPPEAAPSGEAGEAPATRKAEKRSIVIVFDALGASTALRMSQAKSAAQKFVRTRTGPGDLVAVYQLDLSLRAVSGVSSRPEETAKAIDRVAWMPASSLQDDISESVLAYSSTPMNPLAEERLAGMAELATSQLDWQRNHVYESLDGLAQLFEGLPGKRILVVASPGFPMMTTGDVRLQSGGFTPKFQQLIKTLSRLGVTAYTLDIGGDLAMGDAGEKIDWRVVAGKMGMDENILTDLGLERSMGTATASARREFLGVLAAESGGRMLTSTDLNRDFDTIQEETTHFYRVACRVPLGDGKRYKRTVIRVNIPNATVATRRGHYGDVPPASRAAADTSTTSESLASYKPLSARGASLVLPSSDPRKLPVVVVVEAVGPIGISTSPDGEGALDVEFRLVARAAGEIVNRYERSFTGKVRPEGVAALREALRVEGRLHLVPGLYEVQGSLRILDPPQLATWTSSLAVPPPPSGASVAIAEAFLVADESSASPLVSRPDVAPESDPLTLGAGTRVLPAVSADFATGRALLVVGWLRGVPLTDGKPALLIGVHVFDAGGKPVDVPTQLLQFSPEPTGGYRALARVEASSLPPGSYGLRLEAAGLPDGPTSAKRTLPFTLHANEPATPPPAAGASAPATSSAP